MISAESLRVCSDLKPVNWSFPSEWTYADPQSLHILWVSDKPRGVLQHAKIRRPLGLYPRRQGCRSSGTPKLTKIPISINPYPCLHLFMVDGKTPGSLVRSILWLNSRYFKIKIMAKLAKRRWLRWWRCPFLDPQSSHQISSNPHFLRINHHKSICILIPISSLQLSCGKGKLRNTNGSSVFRWIPLAQLTVPSIHFLWTSGWGIWMFG